MARNPKGPRVEWNARRGVYEIRWTERSADGKSRSRRLSTGTAAFQEAQTIFAGWLTEHQHDTGEREEAPTVERVMEQYLEERNDTERARIAAEFIGRGLGSLPADELDQDRIDQYVRDRKSGRLSGRSQPVRSDATLRRELNVLVAALNHAVRRRRLGADAVPHLSLPRSAPPAEFWLAESEVDALLDYAARCSDASPDGRMLRVHRYLLLGVGTAARMSAILNLTWRRVDLDSGLVRYDLDNEGRRVGGNGNKRRVAVPIADWLHPWLVRMRREATTDWVLDHPGSLRTAWGNFIERAADDLGNDRYRQLTRHALRHTAATLMARAGVSPWELAGVLGDTVATVTRNYLHHCPDHLRGAVNANAFGGGAGGAEAGRRPQPRT